MSKPITLFTGQWADLTLDDVAKKASAWGFDGLELACWGDHFEVDKALENDSYVQSRWDILNKYNLKCFAISTHLVGQCVADDPIDERHHRVLSPRLWGDGDPEGVRQRCAEELIIRANRWISWRGRRLGSSAISSEKPKMLVNGVRNSCGSAASAAASALT